MKKLLVLVMILALSFSGCAYVKPTLCNQNVEQAAAIAQQIADASDSLAFLQALVPTVPVLALIAGLKLTISTLEQMRAGYCATPQQTEAVAATISSAKTVTAQVKAGKKLTLQ